MPHPSEQLFFGECDDYAATVAFNDRIYPGVAIWRAVCVLDGAYLVADLLRSDAEHTYDWWFHGVPDHSNGPRGHQERTLARARRRSAVMTAMTWYMTFPRPMSPATFLCNWTFPGNSGVRLDVRVLNDAPLEVVHGFEWSRQYSTPEKEFLLLRRDKARTADFVVLAEPHRGDSRLTRFERVAVRNGEGAEGRRGARSWTVEVNGKRYRIVLNPDRRRIGCESGSTRDVFVVEID